MGTNRAALRARGDEGEPWRPTLALASLGLVTIVSLTAWSFTGDDPATPLATGQAHPSVSAGGRPVGTLSDASPVLPPAGGGSSASRVLTQLPVRAERPDPGLAIDLPLPPLLSAAPRGQVLQVTVADPTQRSLEALGAAAPILGATMPITGSPVVSSTDLAAALAPSVPGAGVAPTAAQPAPGATPPVAALPVIPPADAPTPEAPPEGSWTHMAAPPAQTTPTTVAPPPPDAPADPDPTHMMRRMVEPPMDPDPTTPDTPASAPAPTTTPAPAPAPTTRTTTPSPAASTTTPRPPSPSPTTSTASPTASPMPAPGPSHGFSTPTSSASAAVGTAEPAAPVVVP